MTTWEMLLSSSICQFNLVAGPIQSQRRREKLGMSRPTKYIGPWDVIPSRVLFQMNLHTVNNE